MLRWAYLLILVSTCFAQELTIRVVNAKDGKPLPKESVTVQFLGQAAAPPPLQLHTDQTGNARFEVPTPSPKVLSVRVVLTSEHWHCACLVMTETAKVVRDGVTQAPPSKDEPPSRSNLIAKPGEIVIVARSFTLLEKLLYPLIKE